MGCCQISHTMTRKKGGRSNLNYISKTACNCENTNNKIFSFMFPWQIVKFHTLYTVFNIHIARTDDFQMRNSNKIAVLLLTYFTFTFLWFLFHVNMHLQTPHMHLSQTPFLPKNKVISSFINFWVKVLIFQCTMLFVFIGVSERKTYCTQLWNTLRKSK